MFSYETTFRHNYIMITIMYVFSCFRPAKISPILQYKHNSQEYTYYTVQYSIMNYFTRLIFNFLINFTPYLYINMTEYSLLDKIKWQLSSESSIYLDILMSKRIRSNKKNFIKIIYNFEPINYFIFDYSSPLNIDSDNIWKRFWNVMSSVYLNWN